MRRNRRNLEIEESLLFSYYERPASGRAPARERLRLGPLQSDIMMPQRFGAGFPLAHWRPVYLPLMPGPVTRGLTALAVTAQAGPGGARRGQQPGTPPAWRISPAGPPSGPGGRRPPARRGAAAPAPRRRRPPAFRNSAEPGLRVAIESESGSAARARRRPSGAVTGQ